MFTEINIGYSVNYTNILKKLNSQLIELQFVKAAVPIRLIQNH
jgi:hypothetical protein